MLFHVHGFHVRATRVGPVAVGTDHDHITFGRLDALT